MLFTLTGDIRTGKTTWLEARVQELAAAGVPVRGVLAPGVWRDNEKVGIENVLLPSRKRVLLATPSTNGCKAGQGWSFDGEALAHVNAHFMKLREGAADAHPGLLVIDEIGPLELRRGAGLTAALALLDAGPAPAWPHALVVVRSSLANELKDRLAESWGSVESFLPGEAATRRLRSAFSGV